MLLSFSVLFPSCCRETAVPSAPVKSRCGMKGSAAVEGGSLRQERLHVQIRGNWCVCLQVCSQSTNPLKCCRRLSVLLRLDSFALKRYGFDDGEDNGMVPEMCVDQTGNSGCWPPVSWA